MYGIEYAAANGECDARDEVVMMKCVSVGLKFRMMVYVCVGKDVLGLNLDVLMDVCGYGLLVMD